MASIPRPANDEYGHQSNPSLMDCNPIPACLNCVWNSQDSRNLDCKKFTKKLIKKFLRKISTGNFYKLHQNLEIYKLNLNY